VAERERETIAERISAALQAKKDRGEAVGNVANLKPHNEHRKAAADAFAERLQATLRAYRHAGMSQRRIVEELNRQGVKTARGGSWSLQQLQRVLVRVSQA
jgi:DNA invertase Pin-like site-specific DNA recombinase